MNEPGAQSREKTTALIARHENRHIGRRVLVFDELPSTNDHAAAIAHEPDAVGTVVIARAQTAGRGNYGRCWHSPRDAGVWMSVIVDPPVHLRRPVVVTAWAAVSVAEAIRAVIGRQPKIKWPNDVLVGRKKVAGILVEQKCRTVVGIGLNMNQSQDDFVDAELPDAVSLSIVTGRIFDLDEVAAAIIDCLDREYDSILNGELAMLEACWKWRVGLLGRPVELECHDGRQVTGRLVEMAFGRMELDTGEGNSAILLPESVKSLRAVVGA